MKITVVGAGNGGCFTALFLAWHLKDAEVELIYDPNVKPERVGQATLVDPPALLWAATKFNWYNNPIHCLLYTSPSPRDLSTSRMPSSA